MYNSFSTNSLPKLPSLSELGLNINQIRGQINQSQNKASDGNKKVSYVANQPKNVRINQNSKINSTQKQTFWKNSKIKSYPNLLIIPHGEAIAQLISQYSVIAVDAPTGTGKTLYLPYLMAMKGLKIRVAIPTTVAVRDAYKFQRDHSTLSVGYAAGREIKYSSEDQLVYATTGHLTQKILLLMKDKKYEQIRYTLGDIIFIDEVHTATSYITLLIGLLRYLFTIDQQYVGPKIVFMTATFNHGDILEYFPEFPVYKVEIKTLPIEYIYMTTPHDILNDDPNEEIGRIIDVEILNWQKSNRKYHGIIFRPGIQEVEDTIEYLENRFSNTNFVEFYPAYSSLGSMDIDEIFKPSTKMKIIIGTNIIESSVTIEDVGFIIDDMLEKIAETSSVGGNKLTLTRISKAASQQRSGRTGRTIEGRVYRLLTFQDYQTLESFRKREIDRIPIFDIVLQLIDVDLNPQDILKIGISRYEQARRTLIELGMVQNRADRYFVTEIGKFVSSIPLNIQNAFMVYQGYKEYQQSIVDNPTNSESEKITLRSILAVASMIESYGPSYFYIPRRQLNKTNIEYQIRKDAFIEKYHNRFRGQTDIHTFVNIFWEMMNSINIARKYDRGSRHHYTNYILDWSRDNNMNNKKIKEFLNIFRDVESIVESKISNNSELRSNIPNSGQAEILPRGQFGKYGFSINSTLSTDSYTSLGDNVSRIFAQAYFMNRLVRDQNNRGNTVYTNRKTGIQYRLNRNSSFNTIIMNQNESPTEIIVAQTIEVVGKNGKFYSAGIFVPQQFILPENE